MYTEGTSSQGQRPRGGHQPEPSASTRLLRKRSNKASLPVQMRRDDEMEGFELHEAAFPDRAGKGSV